jgi:hypothetical protein
MRRFLLVWLCLALPLVVVTALIAVAIFRHVDLRYVTFVQLLFIPVFQAVVVTWVRRQWGMSRLRWAVREILRHRVIAVFILLDAVFILLGLVINRIPVVAVGGEASLQPWWAAAKALLAGVLLITAACRMSALWQHKVWILGLAAIFLGLSAEPYIPWLGRLPEIGFIHDIGPKVIRWSIVYGGLLVIALGALFKSQSVLRERSALAAFFFDLAAVLVFATALIYPMNFYLRPFLMEPWDTIVRVLVSLTATVVLVGSFLASRLRDESVDPTRR